MSRSRILWLVILVLVVIAILLLAFNTNAATLPAGTQRFGNVAYGSDPLQKLDVYAPSGAKNAPIILMVHGGGWKQGDKSYPDVAQNKVNHFVPEGVIFVSTNYRLSPQVDVMDEAADVAAALAYVQQHAAQWGGDGTRVVLMGHSAGAHLTSLVTTAGDVQTLAGVKRWLGSVELDSAALNIVEIMSGPHPAEVYDPIFGTSKTLWTMASPTLRWTTNAPPMLMVCSSQRKDSCDQTNEFVTATHGKAQSFAVDLDHGAINNDVGLAGPLTDKIDAFLCGLKVGCVTPPPPPKKRSALCNWFGIGC